MNSFTYKYRICWVRATRRLSSSDRFRLLRNAPTPTSRLEMPIGELEELRHRHTRLNNVFLRYILCNREKDFIYSPVDDERPARSP